MSAAYLQRLEAKQKMNYGDKEPSSIPTLNALRVMKYKEQKKDQVHNDPILAVSLMKDATSALVKKVTLINGRETGHIFLYQIGVNDFDNNCQFSVAHILSERHDTIVLVIGLQNGLKPVFLLQR
ncbi:hypothetical protein QTP88_019650 [Uroleucon formosanum]